VIIVVGNVVDHIVPNDRLTDIGSNMLDRFSCRSMLGEHRKAVLNLIDEPIRCRLVVFWVDEQRIDTGCTRQNQLALAAC